MQHHFAVTFPNITFTFKVLLITRLLIQKVRVQQHSKHYVPSPHLNSIRSHNISRRRSTRTYIMYQLIREGLRIRNWGPIYHMCGLKKCVWNTENANCTYTALSDNSKIFHHRLLIAQVLLQGHMGARLAQFHSQNEYILILTWNAQYKKKPWMEPGRPNSLGLIRIYTCDLALARAHLIDRFEQ